MTKRALLVIDIQNDYFPGGTWALESMERRAGNAALVLEYFRKQEELVVHIRHENGKDAPFFVPGTDGAKINEIVLPKPGELKILKNQVNSFLGTNLKETLDDHGISDLVVVGSMSHMCIDAAVRAASDFGFKVTLLEDACATRDLEFGETIVKAEDVHAAFMSALGFAYANVVTTESFLKEN